MPWSCSLAVVLGPTPHKRCTGRGCRKSSSASGETTSSPSGFATPLATLARNFVRATPTVIASPTSDFTLTRSRAAMSAGDPASRPRPPTSRNASSIDIASTSGVVCRNTSNTALLAQVGPHSGRHDDRLRAQSTRPFAAHRGPHAPGLGLVARGQHHAAADDHRPPAERGVVPLLDRGVERVEVGVQDRRRAAAGQARGIRNPRPHPPPWTDVRTSAGRGGERARRATRRRRPDGRGDPPR